MSHTMQVVAAVIVIASLAVLWKLSRRRRAKPWIQEAVCPACGWIGQTSRYAGRCPRCNAAIGERRAR